MIGMNEFTHFNEEGRAKMVDVSDKEVSTRIARASSSVEVTEDIYKAITEDNLQQRDVLAVAQVAGIMGAQKTHQSVPMRLPVPVPGVDSSLRWDTGSGYLLNIVTEVKTKGQTGVEMEALPAASAAALTV